MNIVNPKVGLFFLAFLPQFVTAGSKNIAGEMFVLGMLFMAQATIVLGVIALIAGSLGEKILKRPGIAKWFGWLSAGIFASLGLRLALQQRG